MDFMNILRNILKDASDKDRRLLKAEIKALFNNENFRKTLELIDPETRRQLKNELEVKYGIPVDMDCPQPMVK
jgi:hypothetical protein